MTRYLFHFYKKIKIQIQKLKIFRVLYNINLSNIKIHLKHHSLPIKCKVLAIINISMKYVILNLFQDFLDTISKLINNSINL